MRINFIWDVDGTLLDSYPIMLEAIFILCDRLNYAIDQKELSAYIKNASISEFLEEMSNKLNLDFKDVLKEYKLIEESFTHNTLMNNVDEVLSYLNSVKVNNFIYTHRDKSTFTILKRLNILNYFKEIITKENNFKRKPHPEALLYLIDKYKMDKNFTYYVGDRLLDVECANNAGIKSILYLSDPIVKSNNTETYLIYDLKEIKPLIK